MTTFTGFLREMNSQDPQKLPPRKKLSHMKNSRSESNALYMAKRPAPTNIDEAQPSGCSLQRSDSSPSISPRRQHQDTIPWTHGFSNGEDERQWFSSPRRSHAERDSADSPSRGRGLQSPVKHLENVPEKDDNILEQSLAAPKRSRSPIKKMFGEGGWLSNVAGPKEELGNQKKPGLMEKIKHKIEEIVSLD